MVRRVLSERDKEIERVTDILHDLTNDIQDALYVSYRERNFRRDADLVDELAKAFRAAVESR